MYILYYVLHCLLYCSGADVITFLKARGCVYVWPIYVIIIAIFSHLQFMSIVSLLFQPFSLTTIVNDICQASVDINKSTAVDLIAVAWFC